MVPPSSETSGVARGRHVEVRVDSFDGARPKHVVYPIRSGALIVAILGTDEADFKVKAKH